MSGRVRHWRDGELITNRKTDRRQSDRTPPHEMPDWVLRFLLPGDVAFAVSPGPTPIIGVAITVPGPFAEARGKNQEWVLGQAAKFIGAVAGDRELRIQDAKLTRDAYPRPNAEAPWYPNQKRTLCLIYAPRPSVIIPRALDPALILSVKS